MYFLSYSIDKNNSMFRATGKKQYIDRSLYYVNNLLKTARISSSLPRSQFKDAYLGWANHSHRELKDDGREYPLFESIAWRYVCHMLRLIRQTPELYDDPLYRGQYDEILSFTEKHIFEKWYERHLKHIYRSRTHMASHWAYITMELWHITENPTLKPIYKMIFDNINKNGIPNYNNASLRSQMAIMDTSPESYWWDSLWGTPEKVEENSHAQDTSHGNHVISFIVESHDAGIEWTEDDINLFINTFNNIIWTGPETFAEYVDGAGEGGLPNNFISDGFVKLGRYSRSLQQRLDTYAYGKYDKRGLYAHMALNAKFLLDNKKKIHHPQNE